jgi:hypothetical protein
MLLERTAGGAAGWSTVDERLAAGPTVALDDIDQDALLTWMYAESGVPGAGVVVRRPLSSARGHRRPHCSSSRIQTTTPAPPCRAGLSARDLAA